jgi:hypothetical protein
MWGYMTSSFLTPPPALPILLWIRHQIGTQALEGEVGIAKRVVVAVELFIYHRHN